MTAAVKNNKLAYNGSSAASPPVTQSAVNSNPNVVAAGFGDMFASAGHATSNTTQAASDAIGATASAATDITNTIAFGVGHGTMAVVHGIGGATTFVFRGVGHGAMATVHGIGKVGGIFHRPHFSHSPKKLSPKAAVTVKAAAAVPAAKPAPPVIDISPQWPIHGDITTYFGQSDWPYQAHHTGLDISDHKRSGITPVKPFKPGTVIAVFHSGGLGNHIEIDHGGGLTSVYGHLYSISVVAGQKVDKNTVLGLEGTTGASTGPHLHFEIKVNGLYQNPLNFIPGRP